LTKGTNQDNGVFYPSLIGPTRESLQQLDIPWVIENVQGAKVRRDLTLCGEMFGLDVIRHRYFECSFPVVKPAHVKHRGRVSGMRHGVWYTGPYAAVYGEGGGKGSVARWQEAMGIDWTNDRKSIAEAIPPAYGEYVGRQLMGHIA
jgi:DNA (cytosine-5)-methyltransferase 1